MKLLTPEEFKALPPEKRREYLRQNRKGIPSRSLRKVLDDNPPVSPEEAAEQATKKK